MKIKHLFLIVLVMLVAILYFWYQRGISAADPLDKSTSVFVVEKGSNLNNIAEKLYSQKLISDPFIFTLTVKIMGVAGEMKTGSFRLSRSMKAEEIGRLLTTSGLDIWVTIIEGKRAEEIGEILKNKLALFNDAWVNELKNNEGYLFPDTYLFSVDADINQIINIMRSNFESKTKSINMNNLTLDELVIIASLIEREARVSQDRYLVSSVIRNRLDIGMPLQIDATVQYSLGYSIRQNTWWRKNLSTADLKIDSPYNTYINPGLPPGPICNPGLASMQAAVMPSDTDYLYYITDKDGVNRYARTLLEHNANINKYGL